MTKGFYARLAAMNLKKNGKFYVPYLLTCIGTVAAFYIMVSLRNDTAAGNGSLAFCLELGTYVIAIFSVIFLFYTNSFLVKRRKSEFGLYNVLGMEKKHIGRIMTYEAVYTFALSIALGLAFGVLLSKFVHLVLMRILTFDVRFGFDFSANAAYSCLVLFSIIHVINLLNSLRQVHFSNPIELLYGSKIGEREPKTKWLLTIVGTICLAAAYYIAITTVNPIEALLLFFVAVVLVIIGTFCLFTSGSIAILKLLRRNKNYYYKANHFISVSGMMYRMKQNAAGLASICILSTMVLVMVSSTASLFVGMDDVMSTRYPREVSMHNYVYDEEKTLEDRAREVIDESLGARGLAAENWLYYRSLNFSVMESGGSFTFDIDYGYTNSNSIYIVMIPLEDFNALAGTDAALSTGEILVFPNQGSYGAATFDIDEISFSVADSAAYLDGFLKLRGDSRSNVLSTYYIIAPDVETLMDVNKAKHEEATFSVSAFLGFDLPEGLTRQERIDAYKAVVEAYAPLEMNAHIESRAYNEEEFYMLYGGLFFLGLFLGLIFIMATVLIIYYKQVSEGYDDAARFDIMKKVGLSRGEIKKSIRSQILTMFFLPLAAAAVHICFAFPIITRLLSVLNLTNVALFATCTAISLLVFAIFYAIIYSLTARVYYRVVNSGPVR